MHILCTFYSFKDYHNNHHKLTHNENNVTATGMLLSFTANIATVTIAILSYLVQKMMPFYCPTEG